MAAADAAADAAVSRFNVDVYTGIYSEWLLFLTVVYSYISAFTHSKRT